MPAIQSVPFNNVYSYNYVMPKASGWLLLAGGNGRRLRISVVFATKLIIKMFTAGCFAAFVIVLFCLNLVCASLATPLSHQHLIVRLGDGYTSQLYHTL